MITTVEKAHSGMMENRLPNGTFEVDRRLDARIVRSALDEVKAIQTLLADVYKDAGD